MHEEDYQWFGGQSDRATAFSPIENGALFAILSNELMAMARLDGPGSPDDFKTRAEMEYLTDAFDIELSESELESISSLSDSDDDEDIVQFITGGVRNLCENTDRVYPLIEKLLGRNEPGIPEKVLIEKEDSVFIPTSDRDQLTHLECNRNLAVQVKHVFPFIHSENISMYFNQNGNILEGVLSMFTVNDDLDRFTLVDFSLLEECEQQNQNETRYATIPRAFERFLKEPVST